MKKLLLIFLIPVFSFTQSGDTNGDGFVNLEDLFNVLENWLQEVNANDPESISNIDEMINVVDSLITINRNFDISKNTYFPEGLSSQIINHNFLQGEYVVPEGKRLYILNVQCDGGLFIDNLEIMYNVQSGQSNTLGLPIIINANQTVNIIQANGSFNGFLVDESSNFEGVTIQVEPNTYTVPNNKILFINHYYSGNLAIDNNAVWGSNTTTARYTLRLPTMVSAGQEVSCTTIGNFEGCVINGYLVSEDYFSSVSNSNSSNISEENTISDDSVPIGTINIWSADVAPEGWMLCDGSEINREEYVDLFTLIGINYGAGDGVTTFNVPNLSGRIPVGLDENASNISNGQQLGNSGGEELHTLTIDEMPSHAHGIGGSSSVPGGSYQYTNPNDNASNLNQYSQPQGGDQPHNNMPPYLITNYIIKVE